jgi:hypothetical protein
MGAASSLESDGFGFAFFIDVFRLFLAERIAEVVKSLYRALGGIDEGTDEDRSVTDRPLCVDTLLA